MSVSIKFKPVYVISDSKYPSEKYEVEGVKGLDQHIENCLGGFVERMYSDTWSGNVITTKQKLFDFIMVNKDSLETIFQLIDMVEELKNTDNDDDD